MQIFYNSATEPAPTLIDGNPPVDQSALVAQQAAEIATLNDRIARMVAAAEADKAADAANAAGQGVLDAAAQ